LNDFSHWLPPIFPLVDRSQCLYWPSRADRQRCAHQGLYHLGQCAYWGKYRRSRCVICVV
jgi:hypothetical protein